MLSCRFRHTYYVHGQNGESSWEKHWMAFTPPAHATELLHTVDTNVNLSKEEVKQIDIQKNNGHISLAINQCSGETEANLDTVITHYVETLNEYNLRNLGRSLDAFIALSLSISIINSRIMLTSVSRTLIKQPT